MKLGICTVCGKPARFTCRVCGAIICENCILPYGCKLCQGMKKVKEFEKT